MPQLANLSTELIQNFTVTEARNVLTPLAFFILGVVVYSLFIFKFYRFIAKRDIFELDIEKYNTANHPGLKKFVSRILHFIKYMVIFPLLAFVWFTTFTVLLVFLSKQSIHNVLLVSIAVVGAVRITSYYNEDLSRDLAKMLPFALLGVFLVDVSYFSFSNSITLVLQLGEFWRIMAYYLTFVILLEFILRILHSIFGVKTEFKQKRKEIKEETNE